MGIKAYQRSSSFDRMHRENSLLANLTAEYLTVGALLRVADDRTAVRAMEVRRRARTMLVGRCITGYDESQDWHEQVETSLTIRLCPPLTLRRRLPVLQVSVGLGRRWIHLSTK
jgi:hypothetical protein